MSSKPSRKLLGKILRKIMRRVPERLFEKNKRTNQSRDFPEIDPRDRKAVCRRCNCVMMDQEPSSGHGEFYHPTADKDGKPHWCKNAGKQFCTIDVEVVPFMRKATRRNLKRHGIRA